MKINFLIILLACCAICAGMEIVSAVPPPPTSPPPSTPPPSSPTGIPLDSGIIILAAAGAAYGARKIYSQKAKK